MPRIEEIIVEKNDITMVTRIESTTPALLKKSEKKLSKKLSKKLINTPCLTLKYGRMSIIIKSNTPTPIYCNINYESLKLNYFFAFAKNSCLPYLSTPKLLIIFCVSSEQIHLINAFAPSIFVSGYFSGLTAITPY